MTDFKSGLAAFGPTISDRTLKEALDDFERAPEERKQRRRRKPYEVAGTPAKKAAMQRMLGEEVVMVDETPEIPSPSVDLDDFFQFSEETVRQIAAEMGRRHALYDETFYTSLNWAVEYVLGPARPEDERRAARRAVSAYIREHRRKQTQQPSKEWVAAGEKWWERRD